MCNLNLTSIYIYIYITTIIVHPRHDLKRRVFSLIKEEKEKQKATKTVQYFDSIIINENFRETTG